MKQVRIHNYSAGLEALVVEESLPVWFARGWALGKLPDDHPVQLELPLNAVKESYLEPAEESAALSEEE